MPWSDTLRAIRETKLDIARVDPRGGMPVVPPAGASAAALSALERKLGLELPPSYRDFLACHDGYPGLYQSAGLLSAGSIRKGTYAGLARLVLDDWNLGGARGRFVPIGIDPSGETLFALDTTTRAHDGELEVVVVVNEIGERVPSFEAFLALVLDLLEADLEARTKARGRGPSRAAARPERVMAIAG
jgi:hypothetical protein